MNMRSIFLVLVLAVAAAACSPADEAQPDRLVVLDQGAVVTIDPDGTNEQTIATATDGSFFQPIWSPDRSLIAFSGLETENQIYVARLDDGEVFSTPTGTFSFYFSWSSQNELAILHNSNVAPVLMLDTTSLGGAALVDLVAVESGQPLYFSWEPNGDAIAAHIGADRMLTTDPESPVPVEFAPGAFQAPAWTDRGILAVASDNPRQRLMLIEPDGDALSLASIEGAATFLPNHDGTLVAIQSVSTAEGFQSVAMQTLPRVPANRLVVLDTGTGEFDVVSTDPALAYFWSPADDQLLVLDVVDGPQARWSVWSDGMIEELVRFDPEPSWVAEFLPFFDQYAQSVSLWAPDGSAIAFPGSIEGRAGIWVQEITGEPVYLADGTWVSWAP